MGTVTRVLVFSEEPMLAYGIRCLLEGQPLARLAVSASSCESLLEMAKAFSPDILMADLKPDVSPSLLADLGDWVPGCKLIVLASSLSPETTYQLRSQGVFGILRRSCTPDELLSVLNNAMSVNAPLTHSDLHPFENGQAVELSPREGQLMSLLAQGLRNKEIAQSLGISEGTVKVYLSKLFQKTGASDRFELALYCLRNNAHLLNDSPRRDEKIKSSGNERNYVPALRSVWLRQHPVVAGGARRLTSQVSLCPL